MPFRGIKTGVVELKPPASAGQALGGGATRRSMAVFEVWRSWLKFPDKMGQNRRISCGNPNARLYPVNQFLDESAFGRHRRNARRCPLI
jgi:hypothetical protein